MYCISIRIQKNRSLKDYFVEITVIKVYYLFQMDLISLLLEDFHNCSPNVLNDNMHLCRTLLLT